MGSILWLYQTQFIINAPETDVTENNYGKCSCTAGHKKTLSFNLVKLHRQVILNFTPYNKYLS